MIEQNIRYNNKSISQLVLASSSPRRKELVAALNLSLPVSVFSLDTDEAIHSSWSPSEAVEKLSEAKADAVYKALKAGQGPANIVLEESLILAADTIVVLDELILGKPSSNEDSLMTLQKLQGRVHQVMTGVTLLHGGTGKALIRHRVTDVMMRELSSEIIARYVATGESVDKAGSYGIQGRGAILVEGIQGCYFNVVGLPLSLVSEMLAQFNVEVLQ